MHALASFGSLALGASILSTASGATLQLERSNNGCQQLAQVFPNSTFAPSTANYTSITNHVWSPTCFQQSQCVFAPSTANDLAGGLRILKSTNTKFAVRGGGHLAKPGANAIANGVLIAMENFKALQFTDSSRSVLQVGAGHRWVEVYNYTSQFDIGVAGGRFGDVGVPGLLLGGGINWGASTHGWATSNIKNMEVVLASGQVINANASAYSDIFWAIKGGSSNFGIVTRFDLKAFPLSTIYGGLSLYNYTHANYDSYINAIAGWVGQGGGNEDKSSAIDPLTVITTDTGSFLYAAFLYREGNDTQPKTFENFTTIPTELSDVSLRSNLLDFQSDADMAVFSDTTTRQLQWATGLKATPEAVFLANRTFIPAALTELQDIPNATTSITYQPITKLQLQAARANGGDALDLDPADGGFMVIQIESQWHDAKYDQRFADFSYSIVSRIEKAAKAANLYYPFVYLNDAGFNQTIFENYGKGKSLPKMRQIAKKYDPQGVFQTLMPGGFKIFQ